MRLRVTRVLALIAVLVATMATGFAQAQADGQAAAICPAGRVGLSVHWADAQDALFCASADGLQAMPSIVGLVVRGPDDALTTVDVRPAAEPAADAGISTSHSVSTSLSSSTSSSTSTSCVNGHCTTTSSQLVCVDGSCSNQP